MYPNQRGRVTNKATKSGWKMIRTKFKSLQCLSLSLCEGSEERAADALLESLVEIRSQPISIKGF